LFEAIDNHTDIQTCENLIEEVSKLILQEQIQSIFKGNANLTVIDILLK
jgi:hypothetical protein